MTIARVLAAKSSTTVHTASPDMTVQEVVRILAERRFGAVPVVEGGRVVGIISERDLIYCAAREGGAALARPVREVMTADPITITRADTVLDALSLMTRKRIRHLPVVDQGGLDGFVSIGDLVKYRLDAVEAEAEAMRTYIQTG